MFKSIKFWPMYLLLLFHKKSTVLICLNLKLTTEKNLMTFLFFLIDGSVERFETTHFD